jgi:hypothetical protein
MNNGYREQSFIIVKNTATGAIYPKNFTLGFPTGDKTRVNYTLNTGEELLAFVHTHAEDTTGYYRTPFSPEDLKEFDKNATQVGYTALLEIGNSRYAMVLENVSIHNSFNTTKMGRHRKGIEAIFSTLTSPNDLGIRWQNALVQYLGSASNCGVGLYKSTLPNKNVFTKLNP